MTETIQDPNAEYVDAATKVMAAEENPVGNYDKLSAIGTVLAAEFQQAESDRRLTELRWLVDLRQYKGIYEPEVLARIGTNRSKSFVRKTRVKVKTVDSRCMDLLFPSNHANNWDIQPTPVPTIAPEVKAQLIKDLTSAMNPPAPVQAGQPPAPPAPPAEPSPDDIDKAVKKFVETAAGKMSKVIADQLEDVKYKDTARKVIHSGNLYGTGILKAPLVEKKIRQRYVLVKGKWVLKTETYITPFVDFVPIWRFFPDMTATERDNMRYAYERHLLTKQALLKLADRKTFSSKKIIDVVEANPKGLIYPKYYDTELKALGDRQSTLINNNGLYEVLERWGWLDASQLVELGVKVPEERKHETFFSNVWLFPNGEVIKAVLQPINGVTWPYHFFYFDKDETSIFGEGVASVMRDDQTMLNASTRMMFDNAAITSGPQLEVNMRLIAPNEKAEEMFPFKIWPRTGEDANSPAIRAINMDSHINELTILADRSENNADETTAIPRYMTGENPQNGAAETSSGLSMLMGAASIVMKDIVGGYDEGITKPFISAMYRWNMQFNHDDEIKGDYDIMATGAASMVAKEVRAAALDSFAQLTANPMDAPYIKRDSLNRQRAEAHELVDVVKTEEEVQADANNPQAQAAAQMAQMQQEMQMKTMELTIAKLQGEVAKMSAETERIKAEGINKKLEAAYAAMEAAGIAVTNPNVAKAGDELLRSAGWVDATPQDSVADAAQAAPDAQPQAQLNPPQTESPVPHADGPHVGMRAGIETERLTDGQPA